MNDDSLVTRLILALATERLDNTNVLKQYDLDVKEEMIESFQAYVRGYERGYSALAYECQHIINTMVES